MGISFLTILVFYLPSDSGEKVSLKGTINLTRGKQTKRKLLLSAPLEKKRLTTDGRQVMNAGTKTRACFSTATFRDQGKHFNCKGNMNRLGSYVTEN